jgi:hypothetical protein
MISHGCSLFKDFIEEVRIFLNVAICRDIACDIQASAACWGLA